MMNMRLLFAVADPETQGLMHSLLDSALELVPLQVERHSASSRTELIERVTGRRDDLVFLDWAIVEHETPGLVEELLQQNPKLRVVALLPLSYRQYRQRVWQAGACNSIPKEHMDQEWLSSILCVMYRAMQREAKLTARYEGARLMDASPDPGL